MSEHIPDPVHIGATRHPEAPAIITSEITLTYADLHRLVEEAVGKMRAHGLDRGDRLAVYRSTGVAYLTLLLAAFRSGIIVCPLNTRQPHTAVPALLKRIHCRTIDAEPVWSGLDTIDLARPVPDSPGFSDDRWQLDTPATLVFTSGSMGTPKAVLHTLGNHVFSALGSASFFDLGLGDRWLLDLPLYHVGGLAILFRCVLSGATVVLPEHDVPAERAIAEHGITHASFVATQLLRAFRSNQSGALTNMKALLLGGSAVPPGLVAEAHALGLPVHTSYGMTEMASTITATPPGASLAALGTSGGALPHREVELATDGEILVRGATLFAGYTDGDTLISPTDAGGWFHTSDLGEWVEVQGERMLRVVGRKDHLFISGGENVQPEEIEAALERIDGIRQAIVVPITDEEFGQRPVAFVEAEAWMPEAWRSALGVVLPRFKIPVVFHSWPDDAQTGIKVSRTALRERVEQDRAP